MNQTIKLGIIALCMLLCSAGVLVSKRVHEAPARLKSKVLPIDNPAKSAKLWLQA